MIILCLTFVFLLSACGNDDVIKTENELLQDEQVDQSGEPEKPSQLTMWVHHEEAQLNAYEKITEKFTEEFGIEVELVPYGQGDQLEGISLDGPSGLGPDLFYSAHDQVGNIYNQGLAAELELTENQKERLENYNEDVVNSFSYNGEQYGIPAVVETYVLFYNKSLIDEAPATVNEMMDIANTFKDEEKYGFVIDASNFYFVYPFLTASGGYVFEETKPGEFDVNAVGLNSEGAISGGELIQSWFKEELIPVGMTFDIMNDLFIAGDAAMAVNGPWAIPSYEEALGDDLGISTLPAWESDPISSFSGNKGWLVNYYSENIYWATELALYITNAESGSLYYQIANELPANLNAEVKDEKMQPVLDQIEFATVMPNVPEMDQVWEPMADALQFISQGEDPESVLNEAVEKINQQIEIARQ